MRARLLKPGIYKNEDLAELPFAARYLYTGLWCMADREGRLEDRPRRIKAEVYPYDDVDIDELLCGLVARGFIVRYRVDGAAYIQIVNFRKHQRPHQNESASDIPPPPDEALATMEQSTCDHGEQGFALELSPIPEAKTKARLGLDGERARARDSSEPAADDVEMTEAERQVVPTAPLNGAQAKPADLVQAFCDEMGVAFPDDAGQAIKLARSMVKRGYTPVDVALCTRWLQSEPYWRDKLLNLKIVASQIADWSMHGKPERYDANDITMRRLREKWRSMATAIGDPQ